MGFRERGRWRISAVNVLGAVGIVNGSSGADAVDRVVVSPGWHSSCPSDVQVALKIDVLK